MKTPSSKIPSGRVTAPKSTIPPAVHGALASIFTKLAAKHQGMANGADRATAAVPRPDVAAKASKKGGLLGRTPFLGAPNSI